MQEQETPQEEKECSPTKIYNPKFDGSEVGHHVSMDPKISTYNSPMTENAITFAILHLEGIAHNWWHHRIATQGRQSVATYDKFTQKLTD